MRALALIPALLLLAGCDSAPKITFEDASLTLPEDPMDLPEGPGREVVLENCTACHSPSTMLQQPKVPREKWESIVGKMKKLYKAPVDDAAVPAIVDYMVHMQSQPEAPR
jgi:cytochrome c5